MAVVRPHRAGTRKHSADTGQNPDVPARPYGEAECTTTRKNKPIVSTSWCRAQPRTCLRVMADPLRSALAVLGGR
ncbi:hypothetical protein [Microtetraspora malaysiensis]|uniref:hypothetical protein n=1 Tax=Microtetraspora malaysiensis TaxID=161358 RepID=UPI003D8F7BDD